MMTLETTMVDSDAPEGSAHSNLTQIKGIGPVRQEILHDDLGINTLEDLASAEVEAIETMLRHENQAVSHQEIIRWIEQAQSQIEPDSIASESTTSETIISEALTLETTAPDDLEPLAHEFSEKETATANTLSSRAWNSIGSFTVEFQSRTGQTQTEHQITVRHIETNRTRQWSSFEDIAWQQWMLTQIKTPTLGENAPACLPGENPLITQIKSVTLFQPPNTVESVGIELTQSSIPITIHSSESFELEVVFELTHSTKTVTIQRPNSYLIQCFSKSLSAPHRLMLLSEIQMHSLTHEHTLYKATLPAAKLTSGLYRLQILITFQGAFALSTFVEIPLLQVV